MLPSPNGFAATSVPPAGTWNRFVLLRRRLVLQVNSTEVARGPARSLPERLAWEEVDLAPHLRHWSEPVSEHSERTNGHRPSAAGGGHWRPVTDVQADRTLHP